MTELSVRTAPAFVPPGAGLRLALGEVGMRARILVVDDEKAIVFAMKSYFTRHGFVVDGASGLTEARELIAKETYSLAFLDVRLGPSGASEGLELAESLRGRSGSLPIILLTAHDTEEVRQRATRIGVDFLVKPQPLHKLARLATGLLDSARTS